jgi:hypothetical protein
MTRRVSWLTAVVIGRILAEQGVPIPDVTDDALLLIKRHNVVVGCTPGDAGVFGDAAVDAFVDDAALPDAATIDAGAPDAGIDPDGGVSDSGISDAGTDGCTMIPGDAVTMVLQPHVTTTTDGVRFAVLLVTPARPIIELTANPFVDLARETARQTIYQTIEIPDESLGTRCAAYGGGCGSYGSSVDAGASWTPPGLGDGGLGDGGLVEETIGPYQLVRAQPTSATELAGWLDQLGYEYVQDDVDAVAPYIALGYHVVALRVAVAKPGTMPMTPVALTWAGSEVRVPAALGRGALTPGKLTVFVSAQSRYAFTDARLRFAGWTSGTSCGWYGCNTGSSWYLTRSEIDLDQNQLPALDPVASEYFGADLVETEVIKQEVRVPVTVQCSSGCGESDDAGCCRNCSAAPSKRIDWGAIVLAVLVVLRRRRRR